MTRLTKSVLWLVIPGTLVASAGCTTTSESGTVGWREEFSIGSFAPDIPFVSSNGKRTTLHSARKPITVLAFTSPPPGACCWVRPELVALAVEFKVFPVTVAQVSVPTTECPHGSDCMEACGLEKPHLMSLCDSNRRAWNSYGQPEPDSVMLLNRHGAIVEISPMSRLETLVKKTQRLALVESDRQFGMDY